MGAVGASGVASVAGSAGAGWAGRACCAFWVATSKGGGWATYPGPAGAGGGGYAGWPGYPGWGGYPVCAAYAAAVGGAGGLGASPGAVQAGCADVGYAAAGGPEDGWAGGAELGGVTAYDGYGLLGGTEVGCGTWPPGCWTG